MAGRHGAPSTHTPPARHLPWPGSMLHTGVGQVPERGLCPQGVQGLAGKQARSGSPLVTGRRVTPPSLNRAALASWWLPCFQLEAPRAHPPQVLRRSASMPRRLHSNVSPPPPACQRQARRVSQLNRAESKMNTSPHIGQGRQ